VQTDTLYEKTGFRRLRSTGTFGVNVMLAGSMTSTQ